MDTIQTKRNGIYMLEKGENLMTLFDSIMGVSENHLIVDDGETLIPSKFTTIRQFLRSMDNFRSCIEQKEDLPQINMTTENTSYIVTDLLEIVDDVKELVAGCHEICMVDAEMPTPYQQAYNYLNNRAIAAFVTVIKSLINDVPMVFGKHRFQRHISTSCSML